MSFMDNGLVQIITAGLLSTLLFAALIIYISKHPQKGSKPLKITFIVMFIGGMAIYCTCYYLGLKYSIDGTIKSGSLEWAKLEDSPWLHVAYIMMRSVMDVGMMFYGRNNSSVFYILPESKNSMLVILFWLIHMIAFYTVAGALLVRFGNELLQWIRIVTAKIDNIDLVFGINSDSLAFSRSIAAKKGSMLVYVDSKTEGYDASIRDMGGFIYSDTDALKASPEFLRNIRVKPRKTKLRLCALSDDYDKNLQYAQRMLASLKELKIKPEQTELMLLGTDEWKGIAFQSLHLENDEYKYGNVICVNEFEVAARLLLNKYPLCGVIKFDEDGRAAEDMNALIVGFGRMGQEVLRKIIAGGQFENSKFHAAVFDPDFERRRGFMETQYPQMFNYYDINFQSYDGRSRELFKFIDQNAGKLKYIAVCLKDIETARDIAIRIVDRLQILGCHQKVYVCDVNAIRCYSDNAQDYKTHWIYDSAVLYSGEVDRYAMELNHSYVNGKDAHEAWKQCDYFQKMNLRASVDYLMPLIRKVSNGGLLTPEQLENLARSEHLRYCAFYYTFGFDTMGRDEFISRLNDFQAEIKQYGKSDIDPEQDIISRKQVCLVDWDELDEIARLHGYHDYKAYAREKIDVLAKLMLEAGQ